MLLELTETTGGREMTKRLRDLGFTIGPYATGPHNAITDVAGVRVGHQTVIRDEPAVVRTGITVVEPRPITDSSLLCPGAYVAFNGNGEMTGSHWLDESGLLAGPIGITNTHQVGLVRDQLVAEMVRRAPETEWCLPIVAETYDGFLNDIGAFALHGDDVHGALAAASTAGSGPSPRQRGRRHRHDLPRVQGRHRHVVTGGSGRCQQLHRRRARPGQLRQPGASSPRRSANRCGARRQLVPLPTDPRTADAGSIIIIVATDAPLLADQCRRLARRATVGLARVGGNGGNGSGDIFLAFSTGNAVPSDAAEPVSMFALPSGSMTPLFEATADAVEESIWNAMCAAETMVGHLGRTVHAVPTQRLADFL
ncbi:MAG: P1 family peptidase [Acidimicrobiales bacterium]